MNIAETYTYMKRKFTIGILIGTVILSGCGSSNDQINIAEWMFSDNLNPYECENTLGKAEKEDGNDYTRFFWNNYNICDKYDGTLSLLYFDKQDEWSLNPDRNAYYFQWNTQCGNDEYEHIINDLKNYKYLQKYTSLPPNGTDESKEQYKKENGECINFTTDFNDKSYDSSESDNNKKAYFIISSNYKDGILKLQWGVNRSFSFS